MDSDEHELHETMLEVARHHRDFATISSLIESIDEAEWDAIRLLCPQSHSVLRRVRAIVG